MTNHTDQFALPLSPSPDTLTFLETLRTDWWEPSIFSHTLGEPTKKFEAAFPLIDFSAVHRALSGATQADIIQMQKEYDFLFWLPGVVKHGNPLMLDLGDTCLSFAASNIAEFPDAYGILMKTLEGQYKIHCMNKENMDKLTELEGQDAKH